MLFAVVQKYRCYAVMTCTYQSPHVHHKAWHSVYCAFLVFALRLAFGASCPWSKLMWSLAKRKSKRAWDKCKSQAFCTAGIDFSKCMEHAMTIQRVTTMILSMRLLRAQSVRNQWMSVSSVRLPIIQCNLLMFP